MGNHGARLRSDGCRQPVRPHRWGRGNGDRGVHRQSPRRNGRDPRTVRFDRCIRRQTLIAKAKGTAHGRDRAYARRSSGRRTARASCDGRDQPTEGPTREPSRQEESYVARLAAGDESATALAEPRRHPRLCSMLAGVRACPPHDMLRVPLGGLLNQETLIDVDHARDHRAPGPRRWRRSARVRTLASHRGGAIARRGRRLGRRDADGRSPDFATGNSARPIGGAFRDLTDPAPT